MLTLNILNTVKEFVLDHPFAFWTVGTLMFIIGIIGQGKLYAKCGLPGIAAIVPVWNVVVFLKIVGRPAWQTLLFLVPGYNIYFVLKVYKEVCLSFGKTKTSDYVMCLLLNGLYVLNIGLSDNIEYKGPKGVPTQAMIQAKENEKQLAEKRLALAEQNRARRQARKLGKHRAERLSRQKNKVSVQTA